MASEGFVRVLDAEIARLQVQIDALREARLIYMKLDGKMPRPVTDHQKHQEERKRFEARVPLGPVQSTPTPPEPEELHLWKNTRGSERTGEASE